MNPNPRIGIVGPGAMGLFHAMHLARAGLDVTLLDHSKSRARRISGGVKLVLPADGDRPAPEPLVRQIPCRANRTVKQPFDLLLFTVKAPATAQAAAEVKHLITPETVLVSLQNGLGNVEALQQHQQPELVLAAVTTSGATRVDEHTIIQRGVGDIILGSPVGNRALADEVAELLGRALPAEAVCDIWPVIWRKLAVNCAVNPLTALLDVPNGQLLDSPVRGLLGEVAAEVGQVGRAVGVDLDVAEISQSVADVCRLTAENISSMVQDARAGRHTEIDHLNGAVVREAEKVGVPAPLNRTLLALVQSLEWRQGL